MDIRLIDDVPAAAASCDPLHIQVERLTQTGPILDLGYKLLEGVFDPAVLDPFDVYAQRMTPEAHALRDFVPCYSVAYFDFEGVRYVVGLLSGDLMQMEGTPPASFLAVGNIATAVSLKKRGIRGIGSRLLDCSIASARSEAAINSRRLAYASAEAEPASLGFWKKSGFLWPKGVDYLQPPLEFQKDGSPVHAEVPETLLIAPLDASSESISSVDLLAMIASLYHNWCLRGWVGELSPAAYQRAEEYVTKHVLKRVLASFPDGPLKLTSDF